MNTSNLYVDPGMHEFVIQVILADLLQALKPRQYCERSPPSSFSLGSSSPSVRSTPDPCFKKHLRFIKKSYKLAICGELETEGNDDLFGC